MSFLKTLKQTFGLDIENPEYKVLEKLTDNIEIRQYDRSRWVCSAVQSEAKDMRNYNKTMFWNLFDYISGKNNQNQKIAMTSPVTCVYSNTNNEMITPESNCHISMRFYVPKEFQDNTPLPSDEAFLQDESDLVVAIIQFGGYASMKDYISYRDTLINALGGEASKYDTVNMMTAGYDPPFKPFGRKNEVWLRKIA